MLADFWGAEFVPLTLPPLVIATLAALTCALPGNFLILRRQAMLGDAMSHVVLPGIVAAYLLTGSAATPTASSWKASSCRSACCPTPSG